MKKKVFQGLIILVMCLLGHNTIFAQYDLPENKIWMFGYRNGIDFNGSTPQGVTSSMSYNGANDVVRPTGASVCNPSGQLLFYTDGSIVWNRNGQKMSNAAPSLGAASMVGQATGGSDGAVIIGMPDSIGKYYVFSLTDQRNTFPRAGQLYYSVVDMQLNNGLGNVVPDRRWLQLDTGLSQKMTAVPGDNCNVWLITHAKTSNMFKAYEITWKGINPDPVISNAGNPTGAPFYLGDWNYSEGWDLGEVTVSPDRKKLASAHGGFAELFDFDPATGIVSNGWTIDSTGGIYDLNGICFSPDNSKLYVVHYLFPFSSNFADLAIYQFDLNLATPAAILASKNVVAGMSYSANSREATSGELRLAGNGKIYFVCPVDGNAIPIGSIEVPDLYGPACQANQPSNRFWASPDYLGIGRGMGNEFVKAIANPHPDTTLLAMTDTCLNEAVLTLHAPYDAGFIGYRWDDGSTDSFRTITEPGTYWAQGIDRCSNATTRYFRVKQGPHFTLGNDTTICNVPFRMAANVQGTYYWQDGSTRPVFDVDATGTYWLAVTQNGCTDTQSINITAINVHPDLGNPLPLCNGETLLLDAKVSEQGAVYTWQDGAHEAVYAVRDSGTYWVNVEKSVCTASDTAMVKVIGCGCEALVPNAFSPNGDGMNDYFLPQFRDCDGVQNYILSVYNRYGQRIYSGTVPLPGWDGTYQDIPVDAGTYFYDLQYLTPRKATRYQKGDITLIR